MRCRALKYDTGWLHIYRDLYDLIPLLRAPAAVLLLPSAGPAIIITCYARRASLKKLDQAEM